MKVLPVIHILDKNQACEQAALLVSCGCDGFWLINHAGNDQLTLSLGVMLSKRYSSLIVGVNLLSHSAESAIIEIINHELTYLWLDYAGVHSVKPDDSLLGQLKNFSQKHNIQIFAGTAFKYQLTEPDPVIASEIARSHGLTVTTSGAGTGHAASIQKIKLMSQAVDGNLAIASGLTLDNLDEYHPYIEYAFVATGISLDEHSFDTDKVMNFVKRNQKLNFIKAK